MKEYNSLVNDYNRLAERISSGAARYREILSGGYERAESMEAEAQTLEERNREIERQLRAEEPFVVAPSQAQEVERLRAELEENTGRISQLRSDAADERMQYYSSLQLAEDWEQNSAPLTASQAAQIARAGGDNSPYYNGSSVYDYINRLGPISQHSGYTSDGNQYESYSTMTPEEISVYNYLYATRGVEAANEFLAQLQETLNYRLGVQNYEDMGGLGKALYWIPAGLSQFSSGIEQLFSREAVPTSPTLYTSSMIQQEAQEKSPVLGTLYELGTTLSNMAPSVLASALGGWALGGTGIAAGTAARVAGLGGSALLGASAGGNAYTQALSEGYQPDEARTYATLVGISEGALQYLLGGIQNLGGAGVRAVASKIGVLDNVLGRIARSSVGQLIGNMISEGAEEGIQELLEPAFRTLIFDEEYNADFGDAAYSFLLGALSAGIIEGPGAVRESIRNHRQPPAPDFSAMEGYLGENGVDNFAGVRTLDELDSKYMEYSNRGDAESLNWDEIYNQYAMAKNYLRGMEAVSGTEQTAQTGDTNAAAETGPVDGIVLPETEGEDIVLPTSEDIDIRETAGLRVYGFGAERYIRRGERGEHSDGAAHKRRAGPAGAVL